MTDHFVDLIVVCVAALAMGWLMGRRPDWRSKRLSLRALIGLYGALVALSVVLAGACVGLLLLLIPEATRLIPLVSVLAFIPAVLIINWAERKVARR
jgi:CHASE2 domain-containing sensor protein